MDNIVRGVNRCLMAAGYLKTTPLVTYNLAQDRYRLLSSSGPSGNSDGNQQGSKRLP